MFFILTKEDFVSSDKNAEFTKGVDPDRLVDMMKEKTVKSSQEKNKTLN